MKYELRPYGVGESYGKGLSAFLDDLPLLYGIGLVAAALEYCGGLLIKEIRVQQSLGATLGNVGIILLSSIVSVIVGSLASGLSARFIAARFLGERDRRALLAAVLKRAPVLVGVSVLSGLLIFGGMLLLVVPGVIFAFRFTFAGEIAVLEDLRPVACLKRSRALARGRWLKILALNLIAFAVSFIQSLLIGLVERLAPGASAAVNIALNGLTIPFCAAASVIFYLGVRVEAESLDVERLAASFPTKAEGTA